ncbi:MAG: lipopolysaccharide heptosyltransferase II [Bryobacteraceae bacterium]
MLSRNKTRILLRSTNWVGDAVMSLPAIRAIRESFPGAHLSLLARPSVTGIFARERSIDQVIEHSNDRKKTAGQLRKENFDWAILFPNSFDSALLVWMAKIPRRTGYARDGRRWLLTEAIPPPEPGEIPRHERFYYLELLRRAAVIHRYPPCPEIRLDGRAEARAAGVEALRQAGLAGPVIGVSPGAAYGNAKRWLPEGFAEAAVRIAGTHSAAVALFGSPGERDVCESIARRVREEGVEAYNYAGQTSMREFIDLAAACQLFLSNDSGAMHIVSALGVPSVTVFGATDDTATGPTGTWARIVREQVECSPCLLRECPIDHRCMTRVSAKRVAETALRLWEESRI